MLKGRALRSWNFIRGLQSFRIICNIKIILIKVNIITWLKVEQIICLSKEEVERITDRNLMWKIFSIKNKKKSERSHWSHDFHYSFHWIRMLMLQIHLETYKSIKPIIEQNHPTKHIHKKTKNTKNITYDEESIVQIRSLREAKQKYL